MEHFLHPPITRQQLCQILHPIVPRDITLYWTALTHTSIFAVLNTEGVEVHDFYKTGHPLYGNNYEKLEFLGDSIIHTALASILIRMYPDKDEGFLSRVRINIERKSGLAQLCRQIGLSRYVMKHPDLDLTDAMLENVYEGFVGALFEDQQMFLYNGLQRCNEFILRTLHNRFKNIHEIRNDDNYKDTVLRLLDRHVFQTIDWVYQKSDDRELIHRRENHLTTLVCIFFQERVSFVSQHGYSHPDLQNIMNSLIVQGEPRILRITKRSRNKRDSEQLASQELMTRLKIQMKQL